MIGDFYVVKYLEDDFKFGWWDKFVGSGKMIDINKYFVICLNVLGGCQGIIGFFFIDFDIGKFYGVWFFIIIIKDMVNV